MSWRHWRIRTALGLAPVLAPASVFIPLGAILGPRGVNLLSVDVQAQLDPVMSLALAVLGVFAGMAIDFRSRAERRLLAAATLEALVTVAVVAAALVILLRTWAAPIGDSPWHVAVALGLCAAASATVMGGHERAAGPIDRVAELDDAVVIAAGGIVLVAGGASTTELARAVAGAIGVGAALGIAGWLLFEHSSHAAERGVFVLGTLALLAGVAAYLRWSPLLVGTVAGAVWRWAPGRADQVIRNDLAKIQHPVIVLLLLLAGASPAGRLALWLFAPLLVFRVAGKLVGARFAALVLPGVNATELGTRLLPCGALAIAIAVNFRQLSDSPAAAAVVAAVAGAAVVFEIVTPLTAGGAAAEA